MDWVDSLGGDLGPHVESQDDFSDASEDDIADMDLWKKTVVDKVKEMMREVTHVFQVMNKVGTDRDADSKRIRDLEDKFMFKDARLETVEAKVQIIYDHVLRDKPHTSQKRDETLKPSNDPYHVTHTPSKPPVTNAEKPKKRRNRKKKKGDASPAAIPSSWVVMQSDSE